MMDDGDDDNDVRWYLSLYIGIYITMVVIVTLHKRKRIMSWPSSTPSSHIYIVILKVKYQCGLINIIVAATTKSSDKFINEPL